MLFLHVERIANLVFGYLKVVVVGGCGDGVVYGGRRRRQLINPQRVLCVDNLSFSRTSRAVCTVCVTTDCSSFVSVSLVALDLCPKFPRVRIADLKAVDFLQQVR